MGHMEKQPAKRLNESKDSPAITSARQENTTQTMSAVQRAVKDIRTASPNTILQLQRMYGNKAVTNLIQRSYIAPSNTVQRGFFSDVFKSDKTRKAENEALKTGKIGDEDVDQIDMVMSDKTKALAFRKFCQKEFATENFEAYNSIKKYQKGQKRYIDAKAIYNEFVSTDSKRETNVSGSNARAIEAAINDPKVFVTVRDTIFDDMLKDIKLNLTDTFVRFKKSKEYEEMIQSNSSIFGRAKNWLGGREATRKGRVNMTNMDTLDVEKQETADNLMANLEQSGLA